MSSYNQSIERLFEVISHLESPEECRAFMEDLCTIKEIQEMAQRLDIALLLSEGTSYNNISKKLDVSSATISRVNRALNYGSNGYKQAIKKLTEGEQNDH